MLHQAPANFWGNPGDFFQVLQQLQYGWLPTVSVEGAVVLASAAGYGVFLILGTWLQPAITSITAFRPSQIKGNTCSSCFMAHPLPTLLSCSYSCFVRYCLCVVIVFNCIIWLFLLACLVIRFSHHREHRTDRCFWSVWAQINWYNDHHRCRRPLVECVPLFGLCTVFYCFVFYCVWHFKTVCGSFSTLL